MRSNKTKDRFSAPLLQGALAVAVSAHAGQIRKGSKRPYIEHPIAVARMIQEFGGSLEQIAGGLLHDTVEDSDLILSDIESDFGPIIAEIESDCSDSVGNPTQKKSWESRKVEHIRKLGRLPLERASLLVVACDKIHNTNCIVNEFGEIGDDVWRIFKAGPEKTVWYYSEILNVLTKKREGLGLQSEAVVCEFRTNVEKMKGFLNKRCSNG